MKAVAPSAGSPTRSRPRSGWPAACVILDFVDLPEKDHGPRAAVLRAARLPQRPPAVDRRDRAAVVLVQQRRSAPAPSAPASAPGSRSTPSWSSPTTSSRSPRARSPRGPRAPRPASTSSGCSRRSPTTWASRWTRPWRALPERARKAAAARPGLPGARAVPEPLRPRALLLHRLRGRDPVRRAPAHRDRVRLEPGALRGLHARGARARPARAPGSSPSRSRSWSAAQSIAEVCRAADPRGATSSCASVELTDRERQIAERVLKEINARLGFLLDVGLDYLVARPAVRHAVRRRGAAHPAGHPDRLRAGRRALRARRAVDRAAPARQPPAHRDADPAARPRQHADRRRARRGHDPHGRLGRRHRPGRRRARRPGRRTPGTVAGPARAAPTRSPAPTCPAAQSIPTPARSAGRAHRAASSPSSGAREHNLRGHRRVVPARLLRRGHRGVAARASRRWSTTSSTPCSPTSCNGARTVPGPAHDGHRPRAPRQGRARRPEPDRAHAAVQPGDLHRRLRPHPPAVRRDHRGEGPRLPARAGSRSTSRAAAARRAPATARSRSR